MRRLTRESCGGERSRADLAGWCGGTRNALPLISCRDLEIDETRCYPETMARPTKCAPRICGSLLQTSRFEIERRTRLLIAVTFWTGPFFFCEAANPIPFSGKKHCRTDTLRTFAYRSPERACVSSIFFHSTYIIYVERIIILLLRTVFT